MGVLSLQLQFNGMEYRCSVRRLWSVICFKIMTRYTCGFSQVYLRSFLLCGVFIPKYSIWPFSYKRAYICAQKKPIYMRYKQAYVYGVTESRRIRGTELYRQQKTPSCTMELKSNFSLNSAWPQWPRLSRARFGSYSLPSQWWWLLAPRQRICWNPWIVSWETVYAISQMLTETTIDSVRN